MTRVFILLIAMLLNSSYLLAQSAEDAAQDNDEPAKIIGVSEAPTEAVAAARAAAPDVFFDTVQEFWHADEHIFLFKGRLFREEVDVRVTAQGRVLNVNRGLGDD